MDTSTLTSRLRQLVGSDSQQRSPGPQRPEGGERSFDGLSAALGGVPCEIEGGRCVVVDRWYSPETLHGDSRIESCAERAQQYVEHLSLLAGIDRTGLTWDSARTPILFFDLETTGLAGGAGTYVFLVGLAAFVDRAFHTRQFFLTGYGAERPLLTAVASWMARADLLVSFNGRTFDAPLLETRYLFHRAEVPFAALPHIDMVHVARHLWSSDEGCSLRVLEGTVAGVTRRGDIAGVEIPARYVHYARTGDVRLLAPVFEHNRLDLLSLAVLTSIAMGLVEQGAAGTRDARECLGLGRLYERAGRDEQAARCYARAAADEMRAPLEVRLEALRRLARYFRGAGQHADAADTWQRMLTLGPSARSSLHDAARALAIHHEHRSKDLRRAHIYAVRAAACGGSEAHQAAARHRLARLDRKLGVDKRPRVSALF